MIILLSSLSETSLLFNSKYYDKVVKDLEDESKIIENNFSYFNFASYLQNSKNLDLKKGVFNKIRVNFCDHLKNFKIISIISWEETFYGLSFLSNFD